MSKVKMAMMLGFSFTIGFSTASCTALNPNTEGHIISALEAKMSEFKVCYESALDRNRDTKGTVGLKLKIHEESGQVVSSSVERSTINDNEMNTCVANVANDISLPEPPGVVVEGHYDINFDFE